MDWCIVYDKDHYALLVYAYTKDIHYGEAVLKIPLEKIKEKIIELGISDVI